MGVLRRYDSGKERRVKFTMLRIDGLKFNDHADEKALYLEAARIIRRDVSAVTSLKILKRSIDARDKDNLKFVYSVAVEVKGESAVLKAGRSKKVARYEPVKYKLPQYIPDRAIKTNKPRPVVIGFGPAGIFASYALAKAGFCPVVIERGSRIEERQRQVKEFWEQGRLDLNTNVQFGEGGAGAFSDGKLSTGVSDREGRLNFILETLVRHGAPENILYDAKPHIGTDRLLKSVSSIRNEIITLGGEFKFNTCFTGFKERNGCLKAVLTDDGNDIECEYAILAIGHSARDTFKILKNSGISMQQKGFAVGVRVEHLRERIDVSQYGVHENMKLPASTYKLTYHARDGRGVYSFCMCPGGYVVNSSSEEGMLCVNGMSYSARDGINSNSAIVVTVEPKDFGSEDVLAGTEFQRRLERAAFKLNGGAVPVQRYADFLKRRRTDVFGEVLPQIKGRFEGADLTDILPEYMRADIAEAMESFGRKIKGFDSPDALFSGVESRTSSPVRILRDERFSSNVYGLLPCGEGAGYAGGIMSAAADGLKCAEKIIGRDI